MGKCKDPIARERIVALDRRLTETVAMQDRATAIAMEAAEKAVAKAEAANEKRLDGVNEFRRTLSDQAAAFITRKEVEALLGNVEATLSRLEGDANKGIGRGAGADYLWRAAVTVMGALLAGAMFWLALVR